MIILKQHFLNAFNMLKRAQRIEIKIPKLLFLIEPRNN